MLQAQLLARDAKIGALTQHRQQQQQQGDKQPPSQFAALTQTDRQSQQQQRDFLLTRRQLAGTMGPATTAE